MTDLLMPKLSDSMEEGTIVQWLVADGEFVKEGDDLVEIETDKATMTHPAQASGTLAIVAAEGSSVAVGDVIARVGAQPAPGGAAARPDEAAIPAQPRALAMAAPPPAKGAAAHAARPAVALATPLARRVADTHGISLAGVRGSGPRGRITRSDVLVAAGESADAPARAPDTHAAGAVRDGHTPSQRGGRSQALSRTQLLIARRMAEAKATVPHFQVQADVVMDRAVALRSDLKALAASGDDLAAPSLNDLIVKASAVALGRHPRANGSFRGDRFELHDNVNVGVAVAADGALVVPVVHDAGSKSLGQIARETRRLAERVRSGRITPPELSGATFTVSNLGMFGMSAIYPVIDRPQAAILGVGATRSTLAREDGEVVDRLLLTLTVSCDHRILYGADASLFLAEIRALLEAPLSLSL